MTKPNPDWIAAALDRLGRQPVARMCPRHRDSVLDAAGRCIDCEAVRFAETERKQWLEELDRQIRDRVPARFQAATTDHAEVLEWVSRCATDPRTAPSLLLLGPTGTGKTHAAYAALRAVLTTRKATWLATTATDMFAALRPRAGVDTEAEMQRYRTVSLLLIDDLGVAKNSEWVEETTYRVLNHRYEQMRPTILTSNLRLADLGAALGDRIGSRLNETCTRVVLSGPDRRRVT